MDSRELNKYLSDVERWQIEYRRVKGVSGAEINLTPPLSLTT